MADENKVIEIYHSSFLHMMVIAAGVFMVVSTLLTSLFFEGDLEMFFMFAPAWVWGVAMVAYSGWNISRVQAIFGRESMVFRASLFGKEEKVRYCDIKGLEKKISVNTASGFGASTMVFFHIKCAMPIDDGAKTIMYNLMFFSKGDIARMQQLICERAGIEPGSS